MPLFNFKRSYEVKAYCKNCGITQIVKVKMGTTIDEHFSNVHKCEACGCSTLEFNLKTYLIKLIKKYKQMFSDKIKEIAPKEDKEEEEEEDETEEQM